METPETTSSWQCTNCASINTHTGTRCHTCDGERDLASSAATTVPQSPTASPAPALSPTQQRALDGPPPLRVSNFSDVSEAELRDRRSARSSVEPLPSDQVVQARRRLSALTAGSGADDNPLDKPDELLAATQQRLAAKQADNDQQHQAMLEAGHAQTLGIASQSPSAADGAGAGAGSGAGAGAGAGADASGSPSAGDAMTSQHLMDLLQADEADEAAQAEQARLQALAEADAGLQELQTGGEGEEAFDAAQYNYEHQQSSTGASAWEYPAVTADEYQGYEGYEEVRPQGNPADWIQLYDEHHNPYYYNTVTGDASWVPPEGFEASVVAIPHESSRPAPIDTAGATTPSVQALKSRKSPARSPAHNIFNTDDEHLQGNDWRETPWVPPTMKLALRHRSRHMYRGGKASLLTSLDEISSAIGFGTAMYYRFLKWLTILFFLMSLLAVPALLVNVSGQRIQEQEKDPLLISSTSLGNNGLDPNAALLQKQKCDPTVLDCNSTYVQVLGNTIKSSTVSVVITLFDVAYSFVFLVFIRWFRDRIRMYKERAEYEHLTTADFAVRISGLPRTATRMQLIEHFSKLYDLEKGDWVFGGFCCGCCCRKSAGRPRPADEMDVQEYNEAVKQAERAGYEQRYGHRSHGAAGDIDPITRRARPMFHYNEEAYSHKRKGVLPMPVLDVSNSGNRLYKNKWVAEVSMVHPNGPLIRRYLSLKKRQLAVYKARARVKKHKFGEFQDEKKLAKATKKLDKAEKKLDKAKASKLKNRQASTDCVGAYITFNEVESRKRCLNDYHEYSGWKRMCMPYPMRFRGKYKLKVIPAPEPSDVIWENLDTTACERGCRRCAAFLIMLALLLLSILVIFVASLNKIEASRRLPDFNLCSTELPAVYHQSRFFDANQVLIRNRTADSAVCGEDKFYLTFQDAPPANTSRFPCTTPCVDPKDQSACATLGGGAYAANAIVGCYCKQALQQYMSELGLINGAKQLKETEADLCTTFAEDYLTTQGFFALAALCIVVVNVLLRLLMRYLARFEHHHSRTAESTSMSKKLFLAQFMNTGLVTLLVNAHLPNIAVKIGSTGLFLGQFNDFDARWYSVVGVSLVLTMMLNTLGPQAAPLAKWLCLMPCKRWWGRRNALIQHQLNSLYEGATFEIATRYPISLNTVFVSMTYCSGLPILLPLATVSFAITYWVDKITLLRLYSIPPRFNEELAVLAANMLPWACLMHVGVAIWMYGNNDVLKSEVWSTWVLSDNENTEQAYQEWKARVEEWDTVGVVPRLVRANVAPMFLFGLIVILFLISGGILKVVLKRLIYVLTCTICGSNDKEEVDIEHSPFTAAYSEVVSEDDMTTLFSKGGWSRQNKVRPSDKHHHGGTFDLVKENGQNIRIKKWVNTGRTHGKLHKQGTRMLTWEVIAEHALHSFEMMANPKYRLAITAMLEDTAQGRLAIKSSIQTRLTKSRRFLMLAHQASSKKLKLGDVAQTVLSESKRNGGEGARAQPQPQPQPAEFSVPMQGQGQYQEQEQQQYGQEAYGQEQQGEYQYANGSTYAADAGQQYQQDYAGYDTGAGTGGEQWQEAEIGDPTQGQQEQYTTAGYCDSEAQAARSGRRSYKQQESTGADMSSMFD